jgi:hypothetical protein
VVALYFRIAASRASNTLNHFFSGSAPGTQLSCQFHHLDGGVWGLALGRAAGSCRTGGPTPEIKAKLWTQKTLSTKLERARTREHAIWSYGLIARAFDGQSQGLTRDDIVDNITFYWLTTTGVSSARLYWENKLAFFAPKGVASRGCECFPNEICPESWAEKAYPKLIYY